MVNLEEEAVLLSPIFQEWYNLLSNNLLTEYDFGGLYILAYLSIRRSKKWSAGLFQSPIINSNEYSSKKLVDIPHIIELLDENYLRKLFNIQYDNLTVVSIFSNIRFTGIKKNVDNFINKSIVYWAVNKRPFVLLTYIPTPIQVLRMQALGQRVATTFLLIEQLSTCHTAKLNYMEGQQNHSKDAFEFFIHDLKHMENFVDEATYDEQVGFFSSILQIDEQSPKKYIKKLISNHTYYIINLFFNSISISSNDFNLYFQTTIDKILSIDFKQLWNELEYLISDMNCYLPHLMKYLVAKLSINCQKLYQNIWNNIFLILQTSFQDIIQNFSNKVIIISSYECYIRNIWIDLMKSLHIISPISDTTSQIIQSRIFSEIHPYIASMSIMNQSIKSSHIEEKINNVSLEFLELQCICGKCDENKLFKLTPQEEGETLRLYFQHLKHSKENIIPNNISTTTEVTSEISIIQITQITQITET